MTDHKDPPIEEQNYISGLTVVDIGDYRISRGMTRRPFSGCPHHRMSYDRQERRIWCRDCERDIEPFDAFIGLVENYGRALKDLYQRRERVEDAEKHNVRSLAAKVIDKAWRSRTTIPACPHCNQGLFPEDFKNGVGLVLGRDYAAARAKKTS